MAAPIIAPKAAPIPPGHANNSPGMPTIKKGLSLRDLLIDGTNCTCPGNRGAGNQFLIQKIITFSRSLSTLPFLGALEFERLPDTPDRQARQRFLPGLPCQFHL